MNSVDLKFKEEVHQKVILLARERIFMFFHWVLLLAINAVGVVVAAKLYMELPPTDMIARLMMSCTALVYINLPAFLLSIPISKTRKKIRRLKDELNHMRIQIEHPPPR